MLKKSADIMGMPVTVVIVDQDAKHEDIESVFAYLRNIDGKFSPYKTTSEISKINAGKISRKKYSQKMQHIFRLADITKNETHGYFNIQNPHGTIDPSGIVKGYAIYEAAGLLKEKGYRNFYVSIAGDIEVRGLNNNKKWKIGIENPFNRQEIIKVVLLSNKGIATSGTYIRGQHIYNPHTNANADDIVSVTIIAENVYDADRFATAVFAMGEKGMEFVEQKKGLEAYMILKNRTARMTSGFEEYTKE